MALYAGLGVLLFLAAAAVVWAVASRGRPRAAPLPASVPRSGPAGTISDADLAEVRSLNAMGRPISALRLYRDKTGATLAQAKAALAALPPLEYTPPPIVADAPAAPEAAPSPAPAPSTPAAATPAPAPATPAPAAATPPPDDYNEDDETVRALIHFDRMAEAVQMYQEIHGVDLKTAKAAVQKMAPH